MKIYTVREQIEEFLKNPTKCYGPEQRHAEAVNKLILMEGRSKEALCGYSIHCEVCGWGRGGGLSWEDYEYFRNAGVG